MPDTVPPAVESQRPPAGRQRNPGTVLLRASRGSPIQEGGEIKSRVGVPFTVLMLVTYVPVIGLGLVRLFYL